MTAAALVVVVAAAAATVLCNGGFAARRLRLRLLKTLAFPIRFDLDQHRITASCQNSDLFDRV